MSSFEKSKLLQRYPVLVECQEQLEQSLAILKNSFEQGGKLLVMGNGGSSADAEHFCGELMKGFVAKRELSGELRKAYSLVDANIADNLQMGLPAFSLGVSHSLISAFANDLNWEYVYAQQVHVLAQPNDVVFGITTSGNSKNILAALKVAKAKGVKSIALTGKQTSACSEVAYCSIRAPMEKTHEIQELHLPIYHALAFELECHFYVK
jgi:D-sedoheptulose 7-phosphate isomerase